MGELTSAEEFLDYFRVEYDPHVVQVNRLHILQRFHDYIAGETIPADEKGKYRKYQKLLREAYQNFVNSDARTEKVFKVFRTDETQTVFIPLNEIMSR